MLSAVTCAPSSEAASAMSFRRASQLAKPLVRPPKHARIRLYVTQLMWLATLNLVCCLTEREL